MTSKDRSAILLSTNRELVWQNILESGVSSHKNLFLFEVHSYLPLHYFDSSPKACGGGIQYIQMKAGPVIEGYCKWKVLGDNRQ